MAETIRLKVARGGGGLVAALVFLGAGFGLGLWFDGRDSAEVLEARAAVDEADSAAAPIVATYDSLATGAREAVQRAVERPPPAPPDTVLVHRTDTLLVELRVADQDLADSLVVAIDDERADRERERDEWAIERDSLWSVIWGQESALNWADSVIAHQKVQIADRDVLIEAYAAEKRWGWPRIKSTALVVLPSFAGGMIVGVAIKP